MLGMGIVTTKLSEPNKYKTCIVEREKRKKKRYYFLVESRAEKMVKSVISLKKWKNRNVFGIL